MPLLKGPGLLGSVLEVIEKLRLFVRRSVLIWVNCWKDIFITHFFLSAILVALCYLFLLINSSNFCICLFLLNQKICYRNFYESFLQDGTPQVLWILKSYPITIR